MNSMQKKVGDFAFSNGLQLSATAAILDLVSEVGEVCKEYLTSTEYGVNELQEGNPLLYSELGDVMYSLAVLANGLGVDLDDCLDSVLHKYQDRIVVGGDPGSGNER